MRSALLVTLSPALVFAGLRSGRCRSELDCSLNGDCIQGRCRCDAAWSGSSICDVMVFEYTSHEGGYHNSSFASWGGNVVFEDGEFHLFAAQMEEHCGLEAWGTNSAIVRAVSSSPTGPFEYRETVVPAMAHNPTVRRLPNGSFALYMIGGSGGSKPKNCSDPNTDTRIAVTNSQTVIAAADGHSSIHVSVAPSARGPWSAPKQVIFGDHAPLLNGGWTNPSPHFAADGTVYLAFQAGPDPAHSGKSNVTGLPDALVGLARSRALEGPFEYLTRKPITADHFWCAQGQDEDPFLWRSPRGFHILTHGMCPWTGPWGAGYKYSQDGVTWHTSPRRPYRYRVEFDDGSVKDYARVERPQLAFATTHDDGSVSDPIALFNGVCDDGANYVDAFQRCAIMQGGMTYTLARPLAREPTEQVERV